MITRNWNIQFRSEWRMEKVMVNGVMWQVAAASNPVVCMPLHGLVTLKCG